MVNNRVVYKNKFNCYQNKVYNPNCAKVIKVNVRLFYLQFYNTTTAWSWTYI